MLLSGEGWCSVDRWWHVSWKRVGLALLVIFLTPVLIAVVWNLAYLQLLPWQLSRQTAATNPGIENIPCALPNNSLATLPGKHVERFGFSIQLPWNEIYRDQTLNDVALVSSNDGGLLTINSPSYSVDSIATLRRLANLSPELRSESLQTNYALTSAAMNAKPEQVKWWRTRGQNQKDFTLLEMKSLVEDECHGALYTINFGEMRGFQQGDPSVAPYCVRLDLFDKDDRHYKITFGEYAEQGPIVTQAAINAMVASLRPISHR